MGFFDDIAGDWHLDRVIQDRRAGITARLRGQMQATTDRRGLILTEEGTWIDAPWGALSARRVDLWEGHGDQVHVFYEDGRPFHQFDPFGDGLCHHLCGRDDYQGQYDFALPSAWTLTWRVSGPRKDYVMTTTYCR